MNSLSKFHDIPSNATFIVADENCFLKPPSKAVTYALKMLHKQTEAYHANPFLFFFRVRGGEGVKIF